MQTIFDPIWIKQHTDAEHTVTFIFKKLNILYSDEVEIQTIYYESSVNKYVVIDDYGDCTLTWDQFLEMLTEHKVERLIETSLNGEDGALIDKRKK